MIALWNITCATVVLKLSLTGYLKLILWFNYSIYRAVHKSEGSISKVNQVAQVCYNIILANFWLPNLHDISYLLQNLLSFAWIVSFGSL